MKRLRPECGARNPIQGVVCMSKAMDLTSGNFESTVADGVTLIDFWAEWCGPCRMMHPVLDEIADQFEGKVTVGKINVDNEGDLAQKFGVASIPTLVLMKDGEEKNRYVGVTSKTELTKALNDVLGS